MIFRRTLLLSAAALAGCRRRPQPAQLLPERVAEVWQRTAQRELPAGAAAEPPASGAVRAIAQADYTGPGRIEVTMYELTSSGAALDAVQRYPHAPDKVFFYRDEYFTVVRWEETDREALGAFVRALEKHMAETL